MGILETHIKNEEQIVCSLISKAFCVNLLLWTASIRKDASETWGIYYSKKMSILNRNIFFHCVCLVIYLCNCVSRVGWLQNSSSANSYQWCVNTKWLLNSLSFNNGEGPIHMAKFGLTFLMAFIRTNNSHIFQMRK